MHAIIKSSYPIFQKAIVDLLEASREKISKIPKDPFTSHAKIDAIELAITPWDPNFRLILRPGNSNLRFTKGPASRAMLASGSYDDSGPNGYEFNVPSRDAALKHMEAIYSDPTIQRRKPRDISHLFFLAAAEALISNEAIKKMRDVGLNAEPATNDFPESSFQYMVFDDDESTSCNYCEHVLLNRITAHMNDIGKNPAG